ncbi:MAG: exodeoxyribonuclease VII large subunit, partial [Pseudomonadota bacterium]
AIQLFLQNAGGLPGVTGWQTWGLYVTRAFCMAFNEEIVARAVYRSKIPIISAVGHETDWSICDFAADLRAPTPSAAAEMVIASADELRSQVLALSRQLVRLMENCLATLDASVGALRRALHDPSTMLGHLGQRVDDLNERLDLALCNSLKSRKEKYRHLENSLQYQNPVVRINVLRQRIGLLSAQADGLMAHKLDLSRQKFGDNSARLDVLSPLKTLARGYAVAVRADDGRVVTDAGDLDVGGELLVKLHRGRVRCLVESLETAKT